MKFISLTGILLVLVGIFCVAYDNDVRLGDGFWLGEKLGRQSGPGWDRAVVPFGVIASARKTLKGEIGSWEVINRGKVFSSGRDYVSLVDSDDRVFAYSTGFTDWARVNDSADISPVNDLLKNDFAPEDVRDPARLCAYLDKLVFLYQGSHSIVGRLVLSKIFIKKYRGHESDWLHGRGKDISELYGYCSDPEIIPVDGGVQINFNVLTSAGGVERWIAVMKINSQVKVEKITVSQVIRDGEFSWCLVDLPGRG